MKGLWYRVRRWFQQRESAASVSGLQIPGPDCTTPLFPYAVACVLPFLALAIEYWLEPLTGHTSYQLFLGAVALSAMFGGVRSGLCTLAISGLLKLHFFLAPLAMDNGAAALRLLLFLGLGLLLAWLAGAVRSTQRRLDASLRHIGEAVLLTNSRKQIVFMNSVAETLTGWERKDATRRDFNDVVVLLDEETAETVADPVERALHSGSMINLVRPLILKSANGGSPVVEGSVAPIRDDGGKIVGSVTALRDVSERRALETELRTAQKIQALSRLTEPLAHDFNNWLTVLGGHAELLRGRLAGADDPALSESAEAIVKATDEAGRLARQFLVFGSGAAKRRGRININPMISRMEAAIQTVVGDYVSVVLSLAEDLWSVNAVPEQIEQIVINLVANAREAMPRGGILIIKTENVVLPGGRQPSAHVMIEVRDDGCGMDEDTKAQIFEPFFTRKPRNEGAGLGLSLVYSIVIRSGGTIKVSSSPDQGSAFQIYLPRFDGERQLAPPGDEPVVLMPLALKACVLVVENDDEVRKLIVSTLRTKDYSVLEAADGQEALEIASRNINHLDLVVTEIAMPQVTGPELAARLSLLTPDIRVVFLSSYPKPATWDKNGSEPNRAFLFKPFSPGELLARVEYLLTVSGPLPSVDGMSGERGQ